ncbi:RNase adapter RapZ [Dialister sp.]|uniref:RNase adapter RapZ n=1 Tax=Dialister sp. TaxID=1955814 RepID=UPI002E8126DE|nr:RNase adapter RapZ [Dialister sp.]MEE3453505.1 RNase adapter RapZ [Dialister sp.]
MEDDDFRFVIITGMSGAGKTNFMQKLEDMGYYCVDNLPPVLIARFADLCWKSTSNTRHVAVVSDIRGGSFFDALPQALNELENRGIPHEVVFLEASDEALVRRYMETRRQHPLAKNMRIQEGIAAERKILAGVRAQADMIVDTTAMKPSNLQEYMKSRFGLNNWSKDMQITVFSFGFKYGIPIDADMVLDVRLLPNPFYIQKYKYSSGRVKEVADYIEKSPVTKEFLRRLYDFMDFMVDNFKKSGKTQFTIAIGCTGGMHRSVFVTEKLGNHLKERNRQVNIEHRDLHRNRVEHDVADSTGR